MNIVSRTYQFVIRQGNLKVGLALKMTLVAHLVLSSFIPLNAKDTPRYIIEVYDNIYRSMSNGQILKPALIVEDDLNLERSKQISAIYDPLNGTITIGSSFINLTRNFGKDSSNARAYVFSHELAHLVLEHRFASEIGTGFSSIQINKKLKNLQDSIQFATCESAADQWAYFYSYISGYSINDVAPMLLDSVYLHYGLTDKMLNNYPPLSERKKYASEARLKMSKMCEAFDFATVCLVHGDYLFANHILSTIYAEGFRSREVCSNRGTSYLLNAITLMDTIELKYILPVQLDARSRLSQSRENRAFLPGSKIELLEEAVLNFQDAVRLDPEYATGYLNLSIAYWLMDRLDDANYYLKKAVNSTDSLIAKKANLFGAIMLVSSNVPDNITLGRSQLLSMSIEGDQLAKRNLDILDNGQQPILPYKYPPNFIVKYQSRPLPQYVDGKSNNILLNTFVRNRALFCYEMSGDIVCRKWKYLGTPPDIIMQYIFNDPQQITNLDVPEEDLFANSDASFQTNRGTFYRYGDFVVIQNGSARSTYLIKS